MAEAGDRKNNRRLNGGRMRLTCPNCRAQYEIDATAIPAAGRDVQCSACGTTWFQPSDTAEPIPSPAAPAADEGEDDSPAPGAALAAPRVDPSVLEVLREEAERELSERRRSQPAGLEMQGDLGLVTRPPPTADAPRPDPGHDAESDSAATPPSRRNLLPDIEELSSTLQPGSTPRRLGDARTTLPPTAQDERTGFRQGLSLVLLIAVLLVGLYALTPMIAHRIPALGEALAGYVALVDSLRLWVSESLRGLAARVGMIG